MKKNVSSLPYLSKATMFTQIWGREGPDSAHVEAFFNGKSKKKSEKLLFISEHIWSIRKRVDNWITDILSEQIVNTNVDPMPKVVLL